MGHGYQLRELNNSELVAGLSNLIRCGNELTAEVLAHLVELEERMLHLELGFASSFAYCVEALGMSEGAAGRRVAGARVCRRFPQAFEFVARGELHLSALCAIAPQLNADNATELFEACRKKTRRQIESVLAARFPRPDVREQIRRLPARPPAPLAPSEPATRNVEATTSALEEGTRVLKLVSKQRELEPLSETRFGVHFTADAELRELLERAFDLASHRMPRGDLAGLMKLVFARFVQREQQRRFAIGKGNATRKATKTREILPTPPGEDVSRAASTDREKRRNHSRRRKHGRYISAAVRREVHLRDEGRCSFVSSDGQRCGARALLEFDHIEAWAQFGPASVGNLRLRCRAHNQLHARETFGALHVAAKVAARRASGSVRT